MIVAIVLTGPGTVDVEEFRKATDTANGLAEYGESYRPPRDPSLYTAIDTGWTDYETPGNDTVWSYDFDVKALVATAVTKVPELPQALVLQAPGGALWAVEISDLGVLSTRAL
jgi:hypothetical protein